MAGFIDSVSRVHTILFPDRQDDWIAKDQLARIVDILVCPVFFSPQPQQIKAARRCSDDGWQPLGWVRDGLIAGEMLHEVEVTGAMPRNQPWTRKP